MNTILSDAVGDDPRVMVVTGGHGDPGAPPRLGLSARVRALARCSLRRHVEGGAVSEYQSVTVEDVARIHQWGAAEDVGAYFASVATPQPSGHGPGHQRPLTGVS